MCDWHVPLRCGPSCTAARPHGSALETQAPRHLGVWHAQDVVRLSSSSVDMEQRLAALQLFKRGGDADASLAEAEKRLPLEPGLERAK